jgi:division protein CdvB (Snf7/Vps24/ESCRT-III family)
MSDFERQVHAIMDAVMALREMDPDLTRLKQQVASAMPETDLDLLPIPSIQDVAAPARMAK